MKLSVKVFEMLLFPVPVSAKRSTFQTSKRLFPFYFILLSVKKYDCRLVWKIVSIFLSIYRSVYN